jgi:protocatechuate 3,4-dioxygenase, alpha subunit
MKLTPTSSQTVGPFFSIGLEPLCQNAASALAAERNSLTLRGVVLDGDKAPIPDCVLEFFANGIFARVATSPDGNYQVTIPPATTMCEVLVFMRGLLKPTLTRVYFQESALKNDPAIHNIPGDRTATLAARQLGAKQYEWNVAMQGESETVFFDF